MEHRVSLHVPVKCDILVSKEGKGNDDIRVIEDELLIEIGKAQERLNLFHIFWDWSLEDSINLVLML
jgi:hypothetical protein